MKSLLMLAFSIAFPCALKAQQITSTLENLSPYLIISGTYDAGTTTLTYASGVLAFSDFSAFCYDISQEISLGDTVTYQIVSADSVANSTLLAQIITLYLNSDRSAIQAAAAQWAIWEVLTDGIENASFTSGLTQITNASSSAVASLALSYLSQAPSQQAANVTFLSSSTKQDMIAFTQLPIPEPHVISVAVLGALPALRRRRPHYSATA